MKIKTNNNSNKKKMIMKKIKGEQRWGGKERNGKERKRKKKQWYSRLKTIRLQTECVFPTRIFRVLFFILDGWLAGINFPFIMLIKWKMMNDVSYKILYSIALFADSWKWALTFKHGPNGKTHHYNYYLIWH